MKTEAKLWPLDGKQGFKEIWPKVLVFYPKWPIFKLDRDIIQTSKVLVGDQGFKDIWPSDLVFYLT